jgi:thiamine-monophosphate kinase
MKRRSGEDDLVARIARGGPPVRGSGLRLGAGDDAALWLPRSGYETVLTSDWFLEGSHFLRDLQPPDSVGWKCLARATSDIAAMGGTPRCFLLNLALPASHTGHWLRGFLRGLRRAAKQLECALAGGDTTRQKRILINLTVVGEVQKGKAVFRSGARPGDLLFVSGTLGEAELGLQAMRRSRGKSRISGPAANKHLYPEPRIALGRWLAENRFASTMMDVSDGLSSDLARLCHASGVGAVIDEAALPLPAKTPRPEGVRLALHGGDDYELVFTVPAERLSRLRPRLRNRDIACIGTIIAAKQLLLAKPDGTIERMEAGGWDPFRKSEK